MGVGRKAKPTQLKILEGNPGGKPLNKREPKARHPMKAAPAWFDKMHRDLWNRTLDEAPTGLLKTIDEAVLATYVTAYIMHQRATEELCSSELLIESLMGGIKANPLVQVQSKAALVMLRAAAEMGFTPSSRSRVTVDPDDADDEDKPQSPFAVFAGGRRA